MRLGPTVLLLALASLACAGGKGAKCGDGTVESGGECVAVEADADTDADGDTDADADGDTDTDTDPDPDTAPRILTFATNTSEITEGGSVTFTAVVTDPQGIDDLIGGTLVADGGGTYGSFATSSEEGAYSLAVSWNAMHTVVPIEFVGDEDRRFVARFYDQAGHTAEAETTIRLTCSTGAACDGDCKNLDTDEDNCGSCGRVCDYDDYLGDTCTDGNCPALSGCIEDLAQTCDQACVEAGLLGCMIHGETAGWVIDTTQTCSSFPDVGGTWGDVSECSDRMDTMRSVDIGACFCYY